MSILDHAVQFGAFIWKTPLRDGAAAGMPPSRKNGLGLGWARARGAVVNLYIYIFSVQMNAIERYENGHIFSYYFLLRSIERDFGRWWALNKNERFNLIFCQKLGYFWEKTRGILSAESSFSYVQVFNSNEKELNFY